jgi:hypothetical protein
MHCEIAGTDHARDSSKQKNAAKNQSNFNECICSRCGTIVFARGFASDPFFPGGVNFCRCKVQCCCLLHHQVELSLSGEDFLVAVALSMSKWKLLSLCWWLKE